MDFELSGKVALVTGGSRGIGKAVAEVLAEEGADIAICARSRAALEATASELGKTTGRRVVPLVADVSESKSVDALVEQVVGVARARRHPGEQRPASPAVSPTGPSPPSPTKGCTRTSTPSSWARSAAPGAVAPHMKAQGWGRVINIAGQNARIPGGYSGGARNVAMVHFSRSLAEELGPSGITVNVVHPGLTRTEYVEAMVAQRAEGDGVDAA